MSKSVSHAVSTRDSYIIPRAIGLWGDIGQGLIGLCSDIGRGLISLWGDIGRGLIQHAIHIL